MPNFAYVCNKGSNNVSVVNLSTFALVATVGVGTAPQYCAIRPDNSEVWVTNSTGNSVSVISVATNTVTATITGFSSPQTIGFNIAGTTAYVLNLGTNRILPVDVVTHVIGTPIAAAFNLLGFHAMNPTANSLAVDTIPSATTGIQQIAIPSGIGSPTINTGSGGGNGIGYDGAGLFMYWLDRATPAVWPLSVAGNSVISTQVIPGSPPEQPVSTAFTPDGLHVYIGGSGTHFFIIATATNTITTSVNTSITGEMRGISITGDGTQLVFTDSNGNGAQLYSLPGNTFVHNFGLGNTTWGVCTTPAAQITEQIVVIV